MPSCTMVRMKKLQPAEIIHRIGIAPGSTTREHSKTMTKMMRLLVWQQCRELWKAELDALLKLGEIGKNHAA